MEKMKSMLLALTLAFPSAVKSADMYFLGQPEANRCALHINGVISPGDAGRLTQLITRRAEEFASTQFVFFDSPGGSVSEAIKIARILEESGAIAAVENTASCASACAIVYLSAPVRMRTGSLLVHRPYFDMAGVHVSDYAKYSEAQQLAILQIREYLSKKAIPSDIIDKMMTLPSSGAYALQRQDDTRIGSMNPMVEEASIAKCGYSNQDLLVESKLIDVYTCVADKVLYPMKGIFLANLIGREAVFDVIDSASQKEAKGELLCPGRIDN